MNIFLTKKQRPNLTAINNVNRPLRDYQIYVCQEAERKRVEIHKQGIKIAVIYIDGECGSGKDDIMYYLGQYTALEGKILMIAPEIDMVQKIVAKWPKEFAPNFKKPRGFYTMTIQSLALTMKNFLNTNDISTLSEKDQATLSQVQECSTIFVNESHRLTSGKDLKLIPYIRQGLEKLDLFFTVVPLSATIKGINEKAWGVPLVPQHLVETGNIDEWLNPTIIHNVLCGTKVTWRDGAHKSNIDLTDLDSDTENLLSNIFNNQNLTEEDYPTKDDMQKDVIDKIRQNTALKKKNLNVDVSIFTEQSIHLKKIATIEDIVDKFFHDQGTKESALFYTFANCKVDGKYFNYSKYMVEYINNKVKENAAVEYNGFVDRKERKKILDDFTKNKGHYRFIVCKCMLIEDFDKLDLRFVINSIPTNDIRSNRLKQRYSRPRRPMLTDPLDHTTNIKKQSCVYQAHNISSIAVQKHNFDKNIINGVMEKLGLPADISEETKNQIERLIAAAIKNKLLATTDSDFDAQDTLIDKEQSDLDISILQNGGLDDVNDEQYDRDDKLSIAVHMNKVHDVQSGKTILINSRHYHDIHGTKKLTTEQYEEYLDKHMKAI